MALHFLTLSMALQKETHYVSIHNGLVTFGSSRLDCVLNTIKRQPYFTGESFAKREGL